MIAFCIVATVVVHPQLKCTMLGMIYTHSLIAPFLIYGNPSDVRYLELLQKVIDAGITTITEITQLKEFSDVQLNWSN